MDSSNSGNSGYTVVIEHPRPFDSFNMHQLRSQSFLKQGSTIPFFVKRQQSNSRTCVFNLCATSAAKTWVMTKVSCCVLNIGYRDYGGLGIIQTALTMSERKLVFLIGVAYA